MRAQVSLLWLKLVVVNLLVMGIAIPCFAARVLPISVESLVDSADVILHALVMEQRNVWDESQHRILTISTIRVLENFKGLHSQGSVREIYQVGGRMGHLNMKIPGAPSLSLNEDFIFFGTDFGSMLVFYGPGMGKFGIGSQYLVPLVLTLPVMAKPTVVASETIHYGVAGITESRSVWLAALRIRIETILKR